MSFFKIFANAKNLLIDLNDGEGLNLIGFYTGHCIEAPSKEVAKKLFNSELISALEKDYAFDKSINNDYEIDIEEIEEINAYDDDLNIGRVFYDENTKN